MAAMIKTRTRGRAALVLAGCAALLLAARPVGALARARAPLARAPRLAAPRAAPRAMTAPPSSELRSKADALLQEAELAGLRAERAALEVERLKLRRQKQRAQAEAERLGLTSAEAIAAARARAAAAEAERAAIEAGAREAIKIFDGEALDEEIGPMGAELARAMEAAARGEQPDSDPSAAPQPSVWGRLGEKPLAPGEGGSAGGPVGDGGAPSLLPVQRKITPYGIDPVLDAETLRLLRERVLARADGVQVVSKAVSHPSGTYWKVELKPPKQGGAPAGEAGGAEDAAAGAERLAKLRDVLPGATPASARKAADAATSARGSAAVADGEMTESEARAAAALAALEASLAANGGPELEGKVRRPLPPSFPPWSHTNRPPMLSARPSGLPPCCAHAAPLHPARPLAPARARRPPIALRRPAPRRYASF